MASPGIAFPGMALPGTSLPGPGHPPVDPDTIARGQPVPEAVLAQARDHPGRIRIVRRGQVMTADLRPDRLTILIDDSGRVVDARTG